MKTTILALIYVFLDSACTTRNIVEDKLTIILPEEINLVDTLDNLQGHISNDTLFITFNN